MRFPMQPIEKDKHGVVRFRANAIVRWLSDTKRIDLNEIAMQNFNREDAAQFWQLLGYSVSGYGDLSFIPKDIVQQADELAAQLLKE